MVAVEDRQEDLRDIGQKIKMLRSERGITLQEVSEATGLSVSFLSLFENGKSGISLANLQKILKLLNSAIHDLVDVSEDERLVRYEEARALVSEAGGTKVLSLVKNARSKKIWAGLFIMDPDSSTGEFEHVGEEFAHIIQGKAEVTLTDPETGKEEKYILTEGDTLYYPSNLRHRYTNLSRQRTIFIAAVTPPTF